MGRKTLLHSFMLVGLVINEFSSSTSNNDWVEIFNNTEAELNIKNYVIKDTASSDVVNFKTDYFLPSQAHCVIDAGNRLNKKGDVIRLFNTNNEIDCVAYGDGNKSDCGSNIEIANLEEGQFASRQPDGEGSWTVSSSSTKGYSNNETIEPLSKISCYEATPKPSPSPKPSISPTPILLKSEEKPNDENEAPQLIESEPLLVEDNNEVLGLEKEELEENPQKDIAQIQAKNEEEDAADLEKVESSNKPFVAYGLIIIGIGFLGIAGFPVANKYWALYNKRHEETSRRLDPNNRMGKPYI